MVKAIFVREIDLQCGFGLKAAAGIGDGLRSRDIEAVFLACQELLDAAGCVSRIFWPSSDQSASRGDELQKLLGVASNSPLSSRAFRNHFEHFDERIEEWASSTSRHNFVDTGIFTPGAVVGIDLGDTLRVLDPSTLRLTFRGEAFELRPLVSEIQRLRVSTSKMVRIPFWDPFWN